MQSVDTSAEAVEAMARECASWDRAAYGGGLEWASKAAALLRALLRERDEALAALATARADALREAADRMFKAASDAIAHVGHMNSASREAEARRHVHETYAAIIEKEPRA